jgi:hypothetical protein
MAAAEPAMRPDERAFVRDSAAGPFQAGCDRGDWGLDSVSWPFAVLWVAAAPRPEAPSRYSIRFDLSGYPTAAPTATMWDTVTSTIMADTHWPGGTGRVQLAFNPGWNRQALYLPCDRVAIEGHDAWREQHPSYVWNSSKDITHYLAIVHELLNSPDYSGLRGPR